MAIRFGSTKDAVTHGLKILVYGESGAGKTRLALTCPEPPLILSAEAGLLSLREADIQVAQITSMAELREAYQYVKDDKEHSWVILDSLSEIAEVCLAEEKKATKDPRQAYGAIIEQINSMVKAFRDLPEKNIMFIAKVEKSRDESTGMVLFQPAMPGSKLGQQLPYLFDEVLYLKSDIDKEGEITRYFQTFTDKSAVGKDRSGALDAYEEANLSTVWGKICPQKETASTKKLK